MKLMNRQEYLDKLINVMGTSAIKMITVVRHSGKSKLLESFKNYNLNNMKDANIIHINFYITKYEDLKEYHVLENYIENAYIYGKDNIVMIDEVQMCPKLELVINSLHAKDTYHMIYVVLDQMLFC